MFNVEVIQKVSTVSQTYKVRRNSSEKVWLDWPFHRHSSDMTNAGMMTHQQTLVTGTAKNRIRVYGSNGDFYETAIEKLRSNFGKSTKVVSEYLLHLQRLQHPTIEQPASFKDFSNFPSTMADTFICTELCFHHDLQSNATVEQVLKKLRITDRLEWNCHALAAKVERPTLSHIASNMRGSKIMPTLLKIY